MAFVNASKNSTTWTNGTLTSSSFTNATKSGGGVFADTVISTIESLLLSDTPTFLDTSIENTTFDAVTRITWTNATKN